MAKRIKAIKIAYFSEPSFITKLNPALGFQISDLQRGFVEAAGCAKAVPTARIYSHAHRLRLSGYCLAKSGR
jgi:hypothetical protein